MIEGDKLERFRLLAFKQFEGTISADEAKELAEWLNADDGVPFEIKDGFIRNLAQHERRIWDHINKQLRSRKSLSIFSISSLKIAMAAAASVMILGSGYYYFTRSVKPAKKESVAAMAVDDALPGREGAILTLEDGRKIILDSLNNGSIAHQTGAVVVLQNGKVAYNSTATTGDKVAYNTMSTPKGRNYQLVLPDGSKVWLNAESAITYPTRFTNNERKVSVEGEAYFEVVKDAKCPFRVSAAVMNIEVLGTHFNINCYSNEILASTTLLEGAVNVVSGNQHVVLKPEQQSQTDLASGITKKITTNVDIEEVMAWKNGMFQFSEADLKTVMLQLSRWYDVEVVYEGKIPEKKFTGQIPKRARLSAVLQSLSFIGVNFRIEGKKMIVGQ